MPRTDPPERVTLWDEDGATEIIAHVLASWDGKTEGEEHRFEARCAAEWIGRACVHPEQIAEELEARAELGEFSKREGLIAAASLLRSRAGGDDG